MTVQHSSFPTDTDGLYNFQSPLWDRYFRSVRSKVRFPRNYKEVSTLDLESLED
jgi:hypothetical protein